MAFRPRAKISPAAVPSAVRKLNRRLNQLREIERFDEKFDFFGMAKIQADKVNAVINDVFGTETAEAIDFRVKHEWFHRMGASAEDFVYGRNRTIAVVTSAIERLNEMLTDADEEVAEGVLRAYERLDLHPEIVRAASKLYQDGHYSTAVEHAVKALNGLVRLRSGLEMDGMQLMERAFGPSNPTIKFNDLSDQSDKDEQKGFMMMFSGAVSGLRNPRAHGFIQDDPERALEFIAFVSLLAKLLDEAK
jgi:uncharacterized protein (TIGR02391 family)